MKISVVVPVWNGRPLLERLLTTLDSQTERPLEIIAVDNGSTDGAPELARERGARVIPMGSNTGFAAAMNRGIGESRGEWIAALNSDVELAPDYLQLLLNAAEARSSWFAAGKLISAAESQPNRIDGSYDCICRGATAWRVGSGRQDGPEFSQPGAISCAPWTAALFRAELFRKIGALDERFGSYLEDVDFGIRCAVSGYRGWYEPAAVARHHGSAALGRWSPAAVRLLSRNQVFLVAKHYPAQLIRRRWWNIAVAQALWLVVALRHGAGAASLRGKVEGIRKCSEIRKRNGEWAIENIDDFLTESESRILYIQKRTGFDLFWRLYFLLTRGEAK
jgi:GT2 family glycosyltransferase